MLKSFIRKKAKTTALVTGANLFRTGCVFLGWMLLARQLEPAKMGVFAVLYSVMTLVSQLSESGLGVSIVKFLSQAENSLTDIENLLKASFLIRQAVTLLAVLVLGALSGFLAQQLFHDASLGSLFLLAAVGAAATSYFSFVLSVFQGLQRFLAYSIMSFLYGSIWLLGLGVLVVWDRVGIAMIQGVTVIAFLLPALGGHLLVGRPLLGWPTDWTAFRKVASFSKWTALGGVLVLVIMQSDILILNHLSSAREAGLYSVGQRMALSISVLSNSVLTVLFPHMLAKNDLKNLRSYFNSILRLLPVLPVGIGVAALVASPLVSLCFGSNFALAAPVFIVLFAAFLLSVITNACGYLAFGLDRPEIVTLSLAVQLCVLLVAGVPLATLWGATGVACAVLASRICSLGFTMVPIWSAVRRSRALSVT